MIEIQSLLKNKVGSSLPFSKPVICIICPTYPLLFSRAFVEKYAEASSSTFSYRSMQYEGADAVMASLATTFLGQKFCYWLGSLDDLSKKTREKWQRFLESYDGPHQLVFFTQSCAKNVPKDWQLLSLSEDVDATLFKGMGAYFGVKNVSFATHLFQQSKKIDIDMAYLFLQYAKVIGRNGKKFGEDWIPNLIVPDVSLFALSQSLFDQNVRAFYSLWKQLANRYTVPFWTSFWSDQMWRAYSYIRFQQQRKIADAKKIGYRLPFSFLNRSWRKHKPEKIMKAHHFLYDIDYHVKNGGEGFALELFYAIFLQ